MSRETVLQANFNVGAISPRIVGRTDFKKYDSGVALMSNVIPLASGPATFRMGTTYLSAIMEETKVGRLIPFKFNSSQTYMMEFGDGKIRFFRNRAVVLSTTEFTNGNFATGDLTGWTDNSTAPGTAAYSSGALALTGNGAGGIGSAYQALTYIGFNTYIITADVAVGAVTVKVGTTVGGTEVATGTIGVGSSQTFSFTTTTHYSTVYVQFSNAANTTITVDNISINNPEYILKTPWTEALLPSVSYAQSADVVYFACLSNSVKPKALLRYGHANWQLLDVDFRDGPYEELGIAYTLTPAATSGSTNITSSASKFAASDVGRSVRILHSGTWGWAIITSYVSPTLVVGQVQSAFGGTSAAASHRLGAFSDTTGYPAVVTLHEGRIVFANNATHPNRFWMSESSGAAREQVLFSPSSFAGSVADSNSIFADLTAGDVSSIHWMSSGNVLAVGTKDSEWVVEGSESAKALSPTNTRVTRRTTRGSVQNVPALRVDGAVLYAKGSGYGINRFAFTFSKDLYESTSASLLSEHLFKGKTVVYQTYQQEPFSVIWVLLSDGTLNSYTFVNSEEVGGWAEHQIAGNYGGPEGSAMGVLGLTYSGEPAIVEAIEVLPGDGYTELWMIVKRTINGATHRYIEVMENEFFLGEATDQHFLDSAVTYSGPHTSTITGLSHLEGQTVTVLADGAAHPDCTVASGQITLNEAVTHAKVGLGYEGDVETLNFDALNSFQGSSLGQNRRISDVKVRVFETGLIYTGRVDQPDELSLLEPRTAASLMGRPCPLLSGIYEVPFVGSWELSTGVKFKFKSPFAGTVSAIMYKAQVNEG